MRSPRTRLLVVTVTAALGLLSAAPAAAEPPASVQPFGFSSPLGAPEGALNAPVVGIAAHPARHGYWILGRDGGVFTYGGARFHGSTGAMVLNQPVVGLTPTPSGEGYWIAAADGGVFTFGDAIFRGSTGAMLLRRPIVDLAATPTGRGYWLVGDDGGVFSFGDAHFWGSTGDLVLGTSIIGIAATPSGRGYVLAAADGRVFSFGDAPLFASAGALALSAPIVDIEMTPSGRGVWLLGGDGGVITYGDAIYMGGANRGAVAAVGIARTPEGAGYWIATVPSGPLPPANSGTGRRVVYSNSMQRVWLVEADGFVSHTWLVSGRRGVPSPGTYHVFSKALASSSGSLRLPHMTRFAHGRSLNIGFHGIPLRPDGSPIQSDAELGQYRSHGCVRMNQEAAAVLYDWAPIGTTVVVLA